MAAPSICSRLGGGRLFCYLIPGETDSAMRTLFLSTAGMVMIVSSALALPFGHQEEHPACKH